MAITKLITPESVDQTLQVDNMMKGIDAVKDNANFNIDNIIEQAESTLRNIELNSIGDFTSLRGNKCPAY